MNGFEAYKMYLGIKWHFAQSNYSYVKYNGKVRADENSFNKRKDRYFFEKLSKQPDLLNFLVANSLEGDIWVRDLLTAESQETYIKWQRRIQSLTYNFQQELSRISTDFKGYFASQNGQHPQLFKEFRQGNISIETLVILNDMLKFFPIWERKITDDIIWPTVRDKCLRYGEFIKYDKPKMKRIVKDILDVQ
jgi:hypothetical protein